MFFYNLHHKKYYYINEYASMLVKIILQSDINQFNMQACYRFSTVRIFVFL
jgi:hypothetical protein